MAPADENKRGFWPEDDKLEPTWLPVANAQTLARGDAVIESTGVAIALADSARILGVIAQDAVTLATGTLVPVYLAEGATRFVGRQDDTTALSVGDELDLIGATGAMQIDGDASAIDVFRLVREIDRDIGDVIGKRWVFIINKPELAAID